MYRPQTTCEFLFLGTAVLQATCVSILEVITLMKYLSWINPVVYQVPASYVVPMHFGVLVTGIIYQVGLAFDTIRMKNNLQAFGVCVLNCSLFVFSIMRIEQTSKTIHSLGKAYTMYKEPLTGEAPDFWDLAQQVLIGSGVVVGISTVILCCLVYKLHREFAWAIYRHIHGNTELKARYIAYEVLLVLTKFEIYFFLAFIIIYGFLDVHYELPEFPLTISLAPLLFIKAAMAIYFTRIEWKPGAIVALILSVGELVYLLSRIIVLCGNGPRAKTLLKTEMLLFSGLATGFAGLVCLNSALCIVNFDHGLKQLLLYPSWQKNAPQEFEELPTTPTYTAPKQRLDLD